MLVLISSECRKSAWVHTRRIVDVYLERMGDRTWAGHITQDGLDAMRAELSAKASRNMAVAASIMEGHQRFKLAWIVGSTRPFGDNGQVRTYTGHAYDRYFTVLPPASKTMANLSTIVEFAGLWHDVGKANAEFLDKLRGNRAEADTIRHEILSNLVFTETVAHLLHGEITEDAVRSAFADAVRNVWHFRSPDSKIDLTPKSLPLQFRVAAWLIATHHRLPSGRIVLDRSVPDNGDFTVEMHVNENKLRHSLGVRLDPRIVNDRLVEETCRLVKALHAMDPNEIPSFRAAAAYARVALILGDRDVSRATFDPEWHKGKRPSTDDLLANYETAPGVVGVDEMLGEFRRPKQHIVEHLMKIAKSSASSLSDVREMIAFGSWLTTRGLPLTLRERAPLHYDWQNTAVAAVRMNRRHGAGFFAEVLAGTGSGKTRACPKILAAADDRMRYSLLLPLRSLTLQAGTDYRNDLGLNESEVATVIGNPAIQELYAHRDRNSGSESAFSEVDMMVDGFEGKNYFRTLPKCMWRHLIGDRATARFLATPIVVTTIDQIMAAADSRRTSYVMQALRLCSSDIVLDEIDSYGPEDQVAIGRLIYLAGVYGRKVILSSATTMAPHSRGFFDAYMAGYRVYAELHHLPFRVDAGMFSNHGQKAVVFPAENGSYSDHSQTFRNALAASLEAQPVIRRAEIMPAIENGDHETLFSNMMGAVWKIHDDRHTTDRSTGKNVSVIMVRFAHVRSCVRFAKWMVEENFEGIDLKAIVYHSAYPLLAREQIEVFLDAALKRKGKKDNFLRHPLVRKWLHASEHRDNILVVVTTAVEEIGRDHDFDGGVFEPTSLHSGIQAAGRIERHRQRPPTSANIVFLPTTMRSFERNARLPYSRPGPEFASSALNEAYRLPDSRFNMLVGQKWLSRIDAKPRIVGDGSPMCMLEHKQIADFMSKYHVYSLRGYLDETVNALLTCRHAEEMMFRRGSFEVDVWYDADNGLFMQRRRDGDDVPIANKISVGKSELGKLRFLVLDPKQFEHPCLDVPREKRHRRMRRFLQVSLPTYNDEYDLSERVYEPDFGIYRPGW